MVFQFFPKAVASILFLEEIDQINNHLHCLTYFSSFVLHDSNLVLYHSQHCVIPLQLTIYSSYLILM